MASCPSVAELLNRVKSLTSETERRKTEGTFQTAWANSFPNTTHCREQGGFVYIDFPVPTTITRAFVTRAPPGVSMAQQNSGPNASIDLNKPGIKQDNVILVANFHTHPLSDHVGGDPEPSRADMANAYFRGLPGIVISRKGIYSYGPKRREKITNPKGYSDPITPPAIPKSVLEKAASETSPPWRVRNQWEGTRVAARFTKEEVAEDQQPPTEDDDTSSIDVIYVDWSDEDVEYSEVLGENQDSTVVDMTDQDSKE